MDNEHDHISEPLLQQHLKNIHRALGGTVEVDIKELSKSIRGRIKEIRSGECSDSCKKTIERFALRLEDWRNLYIATITRKRHVYPSYPGLRLLAKETLEKSSLEQMYVLLDTACDLLDTNEEDSFALKDAIEALRGQDKEYDPDTVEDSRKKWDEPGYRVKRHLQFRLQDRQWLLPIFEQRLAKFKDLEIDNILRERDFL
ncbi:hypothetical protein FRC01_004932 [Tulasnella sp. 417]|nr:hypothetical protein FRC01_004932 [Tulasnella sp. 417]